jgi:hypothetical protein
MTRFTALLWKEARDHRAALAVAALVMPALSWPLQQWGFRFAQPAWTSSGLVPALVGLALVIVASDLFAMDAVTRRLEHFAALPVRPRLLFGARAAFLALVGAGATAWAWAVQLAILAAGAPAGALSRQLAHAGQAHVGLLCAAAAAAGTLFLSTLGVGGLIATIAGTVLAGLGLYGVASLPVSGVWALGLVPVAFGAAAFLAFTGSRALGRGRARALACGGPLVALLLLLPAGRAAHGAWRERFLSPDDPAFRVSGLLAGPGGRHVAVAVEREGARGSKRVWVLRLSDGALFDWGRPGEGFLGWTGDGLLACGGRDGGTLRRPETGAVVRAPAIAEWAAAAAFSWWPRETWLRWSRVPGAEGAWDLRHRDGRRYGPVWSRGMPAPAAEEGAVLRVTPEGALVRTDLGTREEVVLVPRGVNRVLGSMAWSRDGRFFLAELDEGTAALDGASWTIAAGPWRDRTVQWSSSPEAPGVLVITEKTRGRGPLLVDVGRGREARLDAAYGEGLLSLQPLGDGRIVATDGRAVDLIGADGRLERRLIPRSR